MKTNIIRAILFLLCFVLCAVPFTSCDQEKAPDYILGDIMVSGNNSDSQKLAQLGISYNNKIIKDQFPSLNTSKRPEEQRDTKTITFKGETYELEYSGTQQIMYDTPFDIYKTVEKSEDIGRKKEFRFAVGTDTLVGLGVWLTNDELVSLGPILPDEELIRIAREYLSDFTDMSYYKNAAVTWKSDVNANIYFYNEVGGVMLGDYARVIMDLDGKVGSGFAYPNPSLYDPSLFGEVDTSALEEKRQKILEEIYTPDNISKEKYQYKKAELDRQVILVDDEGDYNIVSYYHVYVEIDGKETRDYAHVAVELNKKE